MPTRTLKFGMKGEDVRLLHGLLNNHLPPTSEQLPIDGDGALDFGPRTLKKVKEFQRVNRIDTGQPDFPDGIVGPHTRKVLESGATLEVRVAVDPGPAPAPFPDPQPLPPLKPPVLMPPTPQTPVIPVPKLHLDNVQVSPGFNHTINFTRGPTDSIFIQLQYTILWKSAGPHTEISFGGVHQFSVNSEQDGNDISIFGQLTRAQILLFEKASASIFGQIGVQNLLLLKPFRPVVGVGAGVQVQWDFIKDKFSIGAQGMPFFNISKEGDHLKVLTGLQGQGFLIFQFDGGPR